MRQLNSLALLCVMITGVAVCQAQMAQLWEGKELAKWTLITPSAATMDSVVTVSADSVLCITGIPIGYIASIDSFKNYYLHLEYRWPINALKNANSGVLVHIASGPLDRNTWPLCIQIQTKISRAGDLLPMAGAAFKEPLSTPAGAKTPQLERQKSDSEKLLGEWNTVDIACKDSVIECSINGIVQNHVSGCMPSAGKIGLQLEGFPYEVRNIWLMRLD